MAFKSPRNDRPELVRDLLIFFIHLGFEISQIVSVWDLVLSEFFQNDIVKLRLISTWFE